MPAFLVPRPNLERPFELEEATIPGIHAAITSGQVHATLGEVLTGARPGRTDTASITLFDSTGMGLQDVAATAAVYRRAVASGVGQRLTIN